MSKTLTIDQNTNDSFPVSISTHVHPKALFVLVHGLGASQKDPTIVRLRNYLFSCGYDLLTYDLSGHGERGRNDPFDMPQHVEDLRSIVESVRHMYKKIYLAGGSMGALVATITSIQSPTVSGVCAINGFFAIGLPERNYKKIYLRFRLAAMVNARVRTYWVFVKRWMRPELCMKPMLVLSGEKDADIPTLESLRWYQRLRCKKKFEMIRNADHKLSTQAMIDATGKKIIRWVQNLA